MQPFDRITDFEEGHKLLKFPPHEKKLFQTLHQSGDFVMLKNDNYVFGMRKINNGNKAGVHIQGYRGTNLMAFADFVIDLTRKMGMPYVWFATSNKALVDDLSSGYNVIEHEQLDHETVYKIAVGSASDVK